MASDLRLVFTTVGDESQANEIAQTLVHRRLAACVNICPGLRSVYIWEGKVCDDEEYMLVIKTHVDHLAGVSALLDEMHSYDLPEMIAVEISTGSERFLGWIRESVAVE